MKLSPFTLIYQPEEEIQERSKRRAKLAKPGPGEIPSTSHRLLELRRKLPGLTKALKSVNPNLVRTLVASIYAQKSVEPREMAASRLWRVITDLQRSKDVIKVAIWDLGAKIGGLPGVIEALNKAQSAFTFFELRAPVPAGLVIQSELFIQWARKRMGAQISKSDQQNLKNHFMFSDFYEYACNVREQIGVDHLAGITQHLVAWEDGEDIYWNYFSTSDREIILVSAYNLMEYASAAGRPLEVAIACIIIAQLLSDLNEDLIFHEENKGCIFDFNDERDTIIESIREAKIEDECMGHIDEKYRDPAEKIMRALRNYSPKAEKAEEDSLKKPTKNDAYWLAQLTKLSNKLTKSK